MENTACPEPSSIADASFLWPSSSTTLPLDGPPNVELTVTVKVTTCPTKDGFGDDMTAVVVGRRVTSSVTLFDVLFEELLSPP